MSDFGVKLAARDFSAMERVLDQAFSAVIRARYQGVSPKEARQVLVKKCHAKPMATTPAAMKILEAYEKQKSVREAAVIAGVSKSRVYQVASLHNLSRWMRK